MRKGNYGGMCFIGGFDPTKKGFSKEAMMKCMFGVFMYLTFDERTQVNGITGMGDLTHFSVKHQMFWTVDDAKKQAAMFNVSNVNLHTQRQPVDGTEPLWKYIRRGEG